MVCRYVGIDWAAEEPEREGRERAYLFRQPPRQCPGHLGKPGMLGADRQHAASGCFDRHHAERLRERVIEGQL